MLTVTGRLVTPGLIDLHAHTFPYGSAIGIPADELVPFQGTTTAVSAGDAGANNLAAYRRFIMGSTRTRLYAFVHIANIGLTGFPVAELYNIDFAQPEIAARALAENAEFVLGVKVRMSENVIAKHGIEPLRRAIRACDLSGVAGAKVMCHIGGVENPELMSEILQMLRPRDILTHCYSGHRTSPVGSPISCRTESCCPRRWMRRSAAFISTLDTVEVASTTPLLRPRLHRAQARTRSHQTCTCSRATLRACPF